MELEGNLPRSFVKIMNDREGRQRFEDWCSREGQTISPDLATTGLRYSEQLVAYIPSDGIQAMNDAISSYVTQHPFDLEPASCSWGTVFGEMDNAKREYEEKGKIGAFRLRLRHGNGVQRNLAPFLECIPTDNGLGILKAGLAVIFNAVKRRSDACEKVFECFASIPSTLVRAQNLTLIHHDEPELGLRLRALHSALFQSIPALIDTLLRQKKGGQGRPANEQTVFSKVRRTIAAGSDDLFGDPVKKVESLVKPINKAVTDLNECARLLNSRNIQWLVDGSKREWKETAQERKETAQERKAATQERKAATQERKAAAQERKAAEKHRRGMDSFITHLYRFVAEHKHKASLAGSYTSSSASSRRVGPSNPPAVPFIHDVDQAGLIDAIASHRGHRLPIQHMRSLVSKGTQFEEGALGRAYYLLSTPAFKRWIGHASSSALLVEGHAIADVQDSVSPLSVFCAALAASLHDAGGGGGGGGVLFFACRLARNDGELGGPLGLAKSLLGQLLTQRLRWGAGRDARARYPRLDFLRQSKRLWPHLCGEDGLVVLNGAYDGPRPPRTSGGESSEDEDKSESEGSDDDDDLKDRQLAALLHVFKMLVRQLPPDAPLYIVLDDVATYETALSGRLDDIRQIARCLFDMCADQRRGRGPPIKLLATAPGRFREVVRIARDRRRAAGAVTVVGLREHAAPSLHSARSAIGSLREVAAPPGSVSGRRRRASDRVLDVDVAHSDDDGSDGDGGDWLRHGRRW
ncbi:hypothetical protein RB599_004844 [Gaeumannomyces hyphopodioides]